MYDSMYTQLAFLEPCAPPGPRRSSARARTATARYALRMRYALRSHAPEKAWFGEYRVRVYVPLLSVFLRKLWRDCSSLESRGFALYKR